MKLTNPRRLISASIGILSVAALSSAMPTLAQGGSMQNDQMQNGSMQNGSMQNDQMHNGQMQNGQMQNGSMQQSAPSSTSSQLNAIDRQFITKAAQSDMTEIKTSQLALKRSQNAQVRRYAQMMVQQHSQSSSKLKPLATRKGVTLPTSLGAENQALLTKLSKLSGTQFDQAYMSGQTKAHTKTQAVYQMELSQGQDADVKAFAKQILPIVTAHLQMAQNMVAGR